MDRSRSGLAMGSLKGHMALNSSAFKPSVNKLSSQYLIQDQMASHYYNLATIKSAIDTTPPKSASLSIKKRDQMKRNALIRQIKKQEMERSMRSSHQFADQRQMTPKSKEKKSSGYHSDGDSSSSDSVDFNKTGQLRYDGMVTSRSWAPGYSGEPQKARSVSAGTRPKSAGRLGRTNSPRQSGLNTMKPNILEITYSGDYLEKHCDRFNNSDKAAPFTPRTKKRKGVESRLAQSGHYAPPTLHPRKDKASNSKDKSSRSKEEKQETMTEKNLKSFNHTQDAERDDYHRRWVEEQSDLIQRLTLEESRPPPSRSSTRSWLHTSTLDKNRSSSSLSERKSHTTQKIEAEEEEAKYLQFINEVTSDILSKGIYSDAVLNQMMERHVQQRSHELSVKKMRKMLKKLKSDLGMSEDLPSTSNELLTSNSYDRYSLLSKKSARSSKLSDDETPPHKLVTTDNSDQDSALVDRKLRKFKAKSSSVHSITSTSRSINDTKSKSAHESSRPPSSLKSASMASTSSLPSVKKTRVGNESAKLTLSETDRASTSRCDEPVKRSERALSLASVSSVRSVKSSKGGRDSAEETTSVLTQIEVKLEPSVPRSPSITSISSIHSPKDVVVERQLETTGSDHESERPGSSRSTKVFKPAKRSSIDSVHSTRSDKSFVANVEQKAGPSSAGDVQQDADQLHMALSETLKSKDTVTKATDAEENQSDESDCESVAVLSQVLRPGDGNLSATLVPPSDGGAAEEPPVPKSAEEVSDDGGIVEDADDYSDDFNDDSNISDGDF